jgi:hypothetical protein
MCKLDNLSSALMTEWAFTDDPVRCDGFPVAAESVGKARDLTKAALIVWDLGRLVDDAVEIVSELATNAYEALDGRKLVDKSRDEFRLILRRECAFLFVGVWDPIPEIPDLDETRDPYALTVRGRAC